MDASEVVARARSQIGLKTIYSLGHGGMHPDLPRAADAEGKCDCSGFTAWCLGVARRTDNPFYVHLNGGWMNTQAIFRDCSTTYGIFDGVPWNQARPGDMVVFQGVPVGHIGVVSESGIAGPIHVIHCSHTNYRDSGDAVRETGAEVFKVHGAIVARCAWVVYP